jgi:hypothetical protein
MTAHIIAVNPLASPCAYSGMQPNPMAVIQQAIHGRRNEFTVRQSTRLVHGRNCVKHEKTTLLPDGYDSDSR